MRPFTLLAALIAPFALCAQGADLQFELCVKQFDEFRDRFNGHYVMPPDPTGTATPPDHRALLRSLMASEIDATTADLFISEVLSMKPAFTLQLDGEPWFSQVRCTVQGASDDHDMMFWLVREHLGAAHKWSILSTDMRVVDSTAAPFIDSRNHECGFTDLLRADLLQARGITPYVGPPSVAGLFAVQDALTKGDWKITRVRQVRMQLLQVPGWFAEVEYRPPPIDPGWITSGWNIIRLERMTDDNKLRHVWNHVLGM